MFKEVLTKSQENLFPMIRNFGEKYYLAGGTAIALQIGHRRSIDFDLFSDRQLDTNKTIAVIKREGYKIDATLEVTPEELTIVIEGVKVTFLEYPFKIKPVTMLDDIIAMPDLLSLAAMKAYTLGRRSKWKDYVDIYFISKGHFSIKKISDKAKEIFEGGFNERLFREQLCYYEDINFSEKIEYVKDSVNDEGIKEFLNNVAIIV